MKNPSPLFVWKLVLVMILAAGVFVCVIDPMPVVFDRRDEALARRLQSVYFNPEQMGIIFFGNSLMNHALPQLEKGLNARLNQEFHKTNAGGANIAPVEITTGGIGAPRLHAVADQLIEANPSVIVIQSEMFVARKRVPYKQPPKPAVSKLGQVKSRMATWSGLLNLKLFGRLGQQPGKAANPPFLQSNQQRAKAKQTRRDKPEWQFAVAKEFWENQMASTHLPEFQMGQQIIQRLHRSGIRVVIVELPVSHTASTLASPTYFKDRKAVLQELSKSGAIVISFPDILPDRNFHDFSHLNPRGRDAFLSWFFPALAQELAGK